MGDVTTAEFLRASWMQMQQASLYKRWAKGSPGEAAALEAYWEDGTKPVPTPASAMGKALVLEAQGYWQVVADQQPKSSESRSPSPSASGSRSPSPSSSLSKSPSPSASVSPSAVSGNRVDLSTKASSISAMLSWLNSNRGQPALVPQGTYQYSSVLSIPPGVDLMMDRVTLLPQNSASSCVLLTGSGTKLTFTGVCRLGAVGARNARNSNPDACGLVCQGASNFRIHADDLTIEGVAGNIWFSYRATNNGTITGKISGKTSGADSYHNTDRTHDMDFTGAELWIDGAGDDLFAVVSYKDNNDLCRNIKWGKLFGKNGQARGISVVGGENVSVESFDIDGTAAASVYISAESSYNTFGVKGVNIKGGKARRPNTQGIHNVSVLFYNSVPGEVLANCSVTGDFDPGVRTAGKTGSGPVTACTVNGQSIS